MGRVRQFAALLDIETVEVANLIEIPTSSTTEVSSVGISPAPLIAARQVLDEKLAAAGDVLLGYGVTPPSGPARQHYLAQLRWLEARLLRDDLRVWQVGDGPRRPARWHRWTCRAHPGTDFGAALSLSIARWPQPAPAQWGASPNPDCTQEASSDRKVPLAEERPR